MPQSEDDRVLSLAMTDHYFEQATLAQMGQSVRDSRPPHLDPETHARILRQLREVDALSVTDLADELRGRRDAALQKTPWWKFW